MMSAVSRLEDCSGFWIPTPMAERLHARIEGWAQCGHSGGVIVGEARLGKTRAIQAVCKLLTNRCNQPIHTFFAHYGLRDVATTRAVFAKLCYALGFQVKRQTSDALFNDIVTYLGEASLANDTRQVALIVDEAQLLSIEQLNAFAEIQNELFEHHINAMTFFVANQDQFEPMGRALLQKRNVYLRERFFNNVELFFGIRSESELASCLSGYDGFVVQKRPPKTAVEYFCPTLHEQGWHLASLAPLYWHHYRERYGLPLSQTSLGMAQFVRTTNLLLMDYLPQCDDKDDVATQEACILKSLAGAGIEPSLVKLVGTP